MAVQKFYTDIDLLGVGQLKNARVENKSQNDINNLTLGAADNGLLFMNTDEGTLSVYNGTQVYETADKAQLISEIARAQTAEGVLQANINAEAAARAAAITAEQNARAAAITAEQNARAAAIAQEVTDRNNAITGAVDGLVDAAPGTLDTLNELAAALADDPNFATTVANNVAGVQANLDAYEAAANGRLTALEARDNVKVNQNQNVNLTANTPYNYSHNLGLTNADTVQCNFTIGGEMVMFNCVHSDQNTIIVTSAVDVNGVTMTAIGW